MGFSFVKLLSHLVSEHPLIVHQKKNAATE